MKSAIYIVLLSWFVASCDCMQTVALYSSVQPPKDPFQCFGLKEIFFDSNCSITYGVKQNSCKNFRFEREGSFVGDDHLHFTWKSKDECRYLGVGFPWGNYMGKDLESFEQNVAIEMMIRTDAEPLTKIPMIFGLRDYGGNQCMTGLNYLGIDGGQVDSVWRKARIPLASFKAREKGVNLKNIKELVIEFQRSGDIHIDNIRLVRHHHGYIRTDDSFTTEVTSLPLVLGEKLDVWWGINPQHSQNIVFIPGDFFLCQNSSSEVLELSRSQAVHVHIPTAELEAWNDCGFGIDGWNRVDMSSVFTTTALVFEIHGAYVPKMKVSLLGFTGPRRRVEQFVGDQHIRSLSADSYEVWMPMKSFGNYDELNTEALKEFRFTINDTLSFDMGNFRLVEFRGNPEKPIKWVLR